MAFTSSMRFSGINTGWDTDMMVQNMMKAESMRLSKMQKTMMLDTYRQEQYRSIFDELKTFQKDFLDVMKAGSLRSASSFASTMSAVDAKGDASSAVTIGPDSKKGDYTIDVKQLAAADLYESQSKIGGNITSREGFRFDVSSIRPGSSYQFTLDGASKKISFKAGDKVEGIDGVMDGVIAFDDDGNIGVRGKNEAGVTTFAALNEEQFMKVFNDKLGDAFGDDAISGKQKVEAGLNSDGGVQFSTNGYHTGFTVSNGSYAFANLEGAKAADFSARENIGLRVTSGYKTADLSVDATGKTGREIIDEMNKQLGEQGMGDKLVAELGEDGKVKFTNYSTTDAVAVSDTFEGIGSMAALGHASRITLGAGGGLSDLGVTSGTTAKLDLNATLGEVFGGALSDEGKFTINGVEFTFSRDTKLSTLIDGVNKQDIGVKMSYDAYNETFKLEATKEGVVNKIDLSGELLTENLGFGDGPARAAADAIAVVNGNTITRSSNEFSFEGVDWTLNKVTDGELTVKSTSDTDKIMESIKGFVEGYNALVTKLRDQTSTMRPKSQGAYFDPLTDEERAEMTETDIKMWDENAKKGLLYNDSILENIESQLRSVLNQSVTMADGSKLSLASIGVTTSRDWTKGGQLEILDDAKLREAIEKYGDDIGTLFAGTADGNKGLAERLNDTLNSTLSTTGAIARKAGIAGTYTETDNEIFRRLTTQNKAIEDMMEQLAVKEQNYYNKFAKIEAAMGQAQSQMQYVQSMMGGGA